MEINKKLCKCGCGNYVNKNYLRGHNCRGRQLTTEHKAKISKAGIGKTSGMKGKHLSDEAKKKISSFQTGLVRSPETRHRMCLAQKVRGRKFNKEKERETKKAYYQNHKEEHSNRRRAWRKSNPTQVRNHNRKRRALKYQTQVDPINEKLVYLRDGWVCQHCKKRVNKNLKHPNPMSASLDHIIPLSKGGTHTYNNVQLAHLSCNLSKRDNILPQGEQMRMF